MEKSEFLKMRDCSGFLQIRIVLGFCKSGCLPVICLKLCLCIKLHIYIIPVAPSVTEAVATLVTPNENRTEHSITVICTVRTKSDADMCVVMAVADGRATRSGKELHI